MASVQRYRDWLAERRQVYEALLEFNVGIGLWLTPGAQILQEQFVPGQPAPLGPDGVAMQPAYRTEGNVRTALTFTFKFL